ncbi:Calbindin-32 [Eumeta japonica]|uniref:Calbindin-32 n=1 Tax=Eumeta variegata TaxID=151549 RepID=A0A4C1VCU4_EUMVA|nr:Calbindin-32 [Eumeta japonica]
MSCVALGPHWTGAEDLRSVHCLEAVFMQTVALFTGNGYIEGTELDGFLREFVSSANCTDVSPESGKGKSSCSSADVERTDDDRPAVEIYRANVYDGRVGGGPLMMQTELIVYQ